MSDKAVVDLNDIFPVKASVEDVQEKVAGWDVSPFKGKEVQLRGCSPTWAHLIVAGKLFGTAASVDFLMDDAKGGVSIPVFRK
ncbi:MAG: hypothetical protein A2901_08045 [Elusimicrobia bacterium RIFCSPLOWO2_01_FULL_54_10]|nr:MAG: hypothetical protein A2901_08045 [Elusimicrobia bacterium RIFCSPLOWO2_01_FULL_54_10]